MNAPQLTPAVEETKRHPWMCRNRVSEGRTCCWVNRAKDAFCRSCGSAYAVSKPYEVDHGTDITKEVSLSQSLEEYQELRERVEALFEQLLAIEERLGVLFEGQGNTGAIRTISLHSSRGHAIDYADAEEVLTDAERQIWGCIVARSGIYRMLSNKRAREISQMLDCEKLPPLSYASVSQWIQDAQGTAADLLREKVIEVFDWLRPHTNYKTNDKFVIGKRVVLEYMVEKADLRWTWAPRVNHHRTPMLVSLETLFKSLDGKGQTTSGWKSDLQLAIEAAPQDDPKGETEFFSFRVFRNGHLHLAFKRPDLVTKLNAIAGGKNLKGNR